LLFDLRPKTVGGGEEGERVSAIHCCGWSRCCEWSSIYKCFNLLNSL